MNLFVKYTEEEIEFLLSMFKKDYGEIELFENMTNYEVNKLCVYIRKEKFPPKKLIEEYDFIWIIEGTLVEFDYNDRKKVLRKYSSKDLVGINTLFGEKNNPLLVYKESELVLFKVKEHNEFSSKFYKNLAKYCYKSLSHDD